MNPDWINLNKQFFEKLGKTYESKTITDLEKPIYQTFDTFQEYGRFITNELYFKYTNNEKKWNICITFHNYPATGVAKKEVDNIKKFLSNEKHYAFIKHNTKLDQIFSEFLSKLGKRSFTGVNIPVTTDTFLQGDFVCQVFFKEDYMKEWDRLYKKHKTLDDKALEELFAFISKPTEINVLIVKNAAFAEKIRKDSEKIIQKLEK